MTRPFLEVCVDTAAGLRAAVNGGADRIELCAGLSLGGLTPAHGLMQLASQCGVPVRAMIRPHGGLFDYDEEDIASMIDDIHQVRELQLEGIVIGAAQANGELDLGTLERLAAAGQGLGMTLHRVVDLMVDPVSAVGIAKSIGIDTILTSGGQPHAADGVTTIRAMVETAADHVIVMPGGGVRAETVSELLADTGARAVHASCATDVRPGDPHAIALGFVPALFRQTDRDSVVRLRAALDMWV